MKQSTIFCALIALVVGAQLIYAHTTSAPAVNAKTDDNYLEDNQAWPGMFFTSESVVEEYEYDYAYCLLYDDADANMFNVEIYVDLETYQRVIEAHQTGNHFVGTLVLNDDYSFDGVEVFSYMPDPEFEMAEASAKTCTIEMYQLQH